jgi:predicted ATPase
MHLIKVRLKNENYPTNRYYPFNIPTLRDTSELTFRSPIAFFVGENGSGKSIYGTNPSDTSPIRTPTRLAWQTISP